MRLKKREDIDSCPNGKTGLAIFMIRIQSIVLLIVVKDITGLGNIFNEYAQVECLKRR